jgi:hypothetical protein
MVGKWMYGWIDRYMDGCMEEWMDGSRGIETLANLPKSINIHFWVALEYFLMASIRIRLHGYIFQSGV